MAQIKNAESVPLDRLYSYVRDNHTNPSAGFYAAIDSLEAVTDSEVTLLDATNPTVFLLESGSVGTAAAIDETNAALRMQYPNLAEKPYELYPHMSDWDYINRFSKPCTEPVGIMIGANALLNGMVRSEEEKCKKAVLPRDTEVTFGSLTFTFMYPIAIRYYDTGTLSVQYVTDEISEFQSLETNIITYEVRKQPDGTQFLYFQVPLMQVKILSTTTTIQVGRVARLAPVFTDQFYYARAFLRGDSTNNVWKEIKTTHDSMAYDIRTPTVLLQVEEDLVTATLPQVYQTGGTTLGEIKLYVYTTKGNINENLSTFDGTVALIALDEDKDLTDFTSVALSGVPMMAVATGITSGGTDGLTFEELRERVIFNNKGRQVLPITNTQVEAELDDLNFEVVKNTDVTTNRIFLAAQKLPPPSNPSNPNLPVPTTRKLLTAANIGVETFVFSREAIQDHPYVKMNQERWTLTPKCLFKQDNGILSLLSGSEMDALYLMEQTAFVNHMNESRYLFTPFHWVVDNSALELQIRPYYLDKPVASTINFIDQNQSLEMAVNSNSREIIKTETGYTLRIVTKSAAHYKNLTEPMVSAQLMFYPDKEKLPVYINHARQGLVADGERFFEFDIKTDFDLDDQGRLNIQDVFVTGGFSQEVWANLTTDFHLFLCTTSRTITYDEDDSFNLFLQEILPEGSVPITYESINIELGKSLDTLWSRARNLSIGADYQTHEFDVPLIYDRDILKSDPVTGPIFTIVDGKPVFEVEHHKGETAYDSEGDILYLYKRGDPVIDPVTQLPVPLPEMTAYKEMDLLMIDGRHYFVTESVFVAYNQEVVDTLLSWLTEDLAELSKRLLEQTKIFFHPKSQLGDCRVDKGDGLIITIDTEQTPRLELFVPETVYTDTKLRQQLQDKAIVVLDSMLSGTEINNSDIEESLKGVFGNAVKSMKLSQLGGVNDLYYAKVISPTKQLSLQRILVIQADGTLIMQENVEFVFTKV